MKYYENNVIELKEILTDEIKQEIIAFLNTEGGTIYVGVSDDGTIHPYTSMEQRDYDISKLSNWINDAFYPNVLSLVKPSFNEDNILKIEVLKGIEKPYFLKEKGPKPSGVYKRVGFNKLQCSHEEILSMIMESKGYYYEKDISEEQKLTFDYLSDALKKKQIFFNDKVKNTIGLLNKDAMYTNLAFLLSDQSNLVVKFAKYDKDMNFLIKKSFTGSLLKILNQVIENVNVYNDISARIDGKSFTRIETKSYPNIALREAILNAFEHADYFIRSNIKIEFFPSYLKITNPGGIYKASLDEVLSGVQTYRNPGLVKVLDKLGYIENFGTGLTRIIDSYSNFRVKPKLTPTNNFFVVELPNINSMNDPINDPINDPMNDPMSNSLSDQDLLILKTINENQGLNAKQLLEIISKINQEITIDKIKNSLKRKLNKHVCFKGSRNSGGYFIRK